MKKRILAIAALAAFILVLVLGIVIIRSDYFRKVETQDADSQPVTPEIITMPEPDTAAQEPDADTAEETPLYTLVGAISDVTADSLVITDAAFGPVQANIDDDTVFGGLQLSELTDGMTVTVIFGGQMTRSVPAQVYALAVEAHVISGTVTEIAENGEVLIRLAEMDEVVRMTLPDDCAPLSVGAKVTCYTSGTQTMSIPPLMNALAVVTQEE